MTEVEEDDIFDNEGADIDSEEAEDDGDKHTAWYHCNFIYCKKGRF